LAERVPTQLTNGPPNLV